MSIWIDLLFMHGHFATPRLLADLVVPTAAQATPPADGPDGSPEREPERALEPEREAESAIWDAVQTWPLDQVVCDPAPYVRPFSVVHHPFRTVGQVR
jgi:hypothetical protein